MLASTSRIILPSSSSVCQIRSVIHHARPPRRPILHPPQYPKTPLATSGTSQPHPPHLSPNGGSAPGSRSRARTVKKLDGTNFTLHHSPPPSAPSYTTGAVPDFLKWVNGGTGVRLTGEEQIGVRKVRKEEVIEGGWSQELQARMKEMRAEGLSRKSIGDALSISPAHHHLIARAAPLSNPQAQVKRDELQAQKDTWGFKKRLFRDMREKRKQFW